MILAELAARRGVAFQLIGRPAGLVVVYVVQYVKGESFFQKKSVKNEKSRETLCVNLGKFDKNIHPRWLRLDFIEKQQQVAACTE